MKQLLLLLIPLTRKILQSTDETLQAYTMHKYVQKYLAMHMQTHTHTCRQREAERPL